MTSVVMRLCRETGEAFVQYVLQPQFLREINAPGTALPAWELRLSCADLCACLCVCAVVCACVRVSCVSHVESEARRLAALQVFAVGVLPFLGNDKLTAFLRYVITHRSGRLPT